jgi:putative DNA primase/helicase
MSGKEKERVMGTADEIIAGLDGNPRTGMACCPAHDDETPSLHVSTGAGGKVLVKCFAGCPQEAVIAALKERGLWPVPGAVPSAAPILRRRSAAERREYALKLLADTRANRGRELAGELAGYFARRGIRRVPSTAMLALPWNLNPHLGDCLVPENHPAMVFSVTDGRDTIGAHITWLTADLTAKREQEPTRQFFGPIAGGYIRLYDVAPTTTKLIIAEGVETALAAAQLAHGLPAIAALSADNIPKITPPPAAEYIIAADNDANGAGQHGARALANKLVLRAGAQVRLAIPPQPDTDWNDVLLARVTLTQEVK